LRVDPIACNGNGLCAEALPELVTLDDWGYPMIASSEVPTAVEPAARRAVALCPRLALSLEEAAGSRHR
jgi:ferredoxin